MRFDSSFIFFCFQISFYFFQNGVCVCVCVCVCVFVSVWACFLAGANAIVAGRIGS